MGLQKVPKDKGTWCREPDMHVIAPHKSSAFAVWANLNPNTKESRDCNDDLTY